MILFYLPHSPYVRKVLVVAHELALDDEIELREAHVLDPSDPVHRHNPAGKVPVLMDREDNPLYDSTVICEYLGAVAGSAAMFPQDGREKWRSLRLNALGDGLAQAATWGMRERIRDESERSDSYIAYYDRAISRCLAAAEAESAAFNQNPAIGEISLACALSYLDLRYDDLDWPAANPGLANWYAAMQERPSMKATVLKPYDGPRQPPPA